MGFVKLVHGLNHSSNSVCEHFSTAQKLLQAIEKETIKFQKLKGTPGFKKS